MHSLNSTIMLKLSYFCTVQDKYASIIIQASILDFQLIIGLQSIRELNLFRVFPEYVGLKPVPFLSAIVTKSSSTVICMPCGCAPEGEFATPNGSPKVNQLTQTVPLWR